jgi:replicative DNA helicase
MKAHPEKYKGIPYSMRELDEVTGGMHKSHLYLVFGRTGAGKSQFLFNIGCNAANSGKKVMYVTIEMNYSMLQNMWAAREARIPTLSITNARLTPDQESMYYMFLEWQKEHRISMYLIDIPQGASTGVIEAEIASYTKINGKAPDLVLVDYANLIQPMGKYKDRTEKIDNVFRELKESARAFNTVLYTAAQQNRESLKASKVGTEHISFSDAASHHCDTVLNIHSNEQDEIGNIVHVDIVKGRYHAKKGCELLWEREFNYIGDWDSISYKGQVRDTSSSDGLRFRDSSGN